MDDSEIFHDTYQEIWEMEKNENENGKQIENPKHNEESENILNFANNIQNRRSKSNKELLEEQNSNKSQIW